METKNRAQAMVELMADILADPEWTALVVAAALVAETEIDESHPAFGILSDALNKKEV